VTAGSASHCCRDTGVGRAAVDTAAPPLEPPPLPRGPRRAQPGEVGSPRRRHHDACRRFAAAATGGDREAAVFTARPAAPDGVGAVERAGDGGRVRRHGGGGGRRPAPPVWTAWTLLD